MSMRWFTVWMTAATILASWGLAGGAGAQTSSDQTPPQLQGVDLVDHSGDVVPGDLVFNDENGNPVRLDSFFDQGRPIVLQLVYYSCPMLCTQVLNAYVASAREMDWTPGKEYSVVTVSFDPKDDPKLAKEKKKNYVSSLDRPEAEGGWHFLTGEEPAIEALTRSVGFEYKYDPKTKQYYHAAGIFVLTAEGKISRTLYGIEYPPKQLRLSLVEASEGRLGSPLDKLILFCCQYDPGTHKYSVVAFQVMKLGGVVTLLGLGGLLAGLWMRERHRSHHAAA
jgi:protein SCO1/2